MNLEPFIRNVPDFPKPGIQFKDITPLLNDAQAFKACIEGLIKTVNPANIDVIVGIESRGFIFGAALSIALGKRFVPVRKKGKLPAATFAFEYDLEYGKDCVEIHKDALKPNETIWIIDDLLATGGTVGAVEQLIQQTGAKVTAISFVVELLFLDGRKQLSCPHVSSLIQY